MKATRASAFIIVVVWESIRYTRPMGGAAVELSKEAKPARDSVTHIISKPFISRLLLFWGEWLHGLTLPVFVIVCIGTRLIWSDT